jgi:polynucleotide 5'-kinase involved in rRNA processing
MNRLKELEALLEDKIIYCTESTKDLFIVTYKNQKINKEKVLALKKVFQKNVSIVYAGEEKGLIVGLLTKDRAFMGLGIIHKIQYTKKSLKVLTSCETEISIVQFGQIKIDENGKELGVCKSFTA